MKNIYSVKDGDYVTCDNYDIFAKVKTEKTGGLYNALKGKSSVEKMEVVLL